jgi:hypothetical protein
VGFNSKTPRRPPYDPNLSKIGKSHTHTWWNDRGRKQQNACICVTGRDHTTPREGR